MLRVEDGAGALTRLNTFAGLTQGALTAIQITGEPAIDLTAAPNVIATTGAADPMLEDAAGASSLNGNADGVREKLQIIANAITNAAGSRYRAELQGQQLAILAKDGTFNQMPAAVTFAGTGAASVNSAIQLNTRQYTLGPDGSSAFATQVQGGSDGGDPGFVEYVGDPVAKTGFHALDSVDLFNLMALPPDTSVDEVTQRQIWGPASIYCDSRRAFLLVDPPDSWTDAAGNPAIVQNTADINNLRATVVKDHAAVFYPKLRINDAGLVRTIGPTGAIAG